MRKVYYLKIKNIFLLIICITIILLIPYIVILNPYIPADKFEDIVSNTIIIDPGHGGIDGGAIKKDTLEKDINLDTALKLKALLIKSGYNVIMTRETDISLEKSGSGGNRHVKDLNARVKTINNSHAKLYISIHVNCRPKRLAANGSIVFYNKKYDKNAFLAYELQRCLNSISYGGMVRSIHNPVSERYYLLDNAKIPGALVEIGFLTNPTELELIKKNEFRQLVAEAIMNGINNYLKNNETYKQ